MHDFLKPVVNSSRLVPLCILNIKIVFPQNISETSRCIQCKLIKTKLL